MSIWTLLIFALSMLAAVLAYYAPSPLSHAAHWAFALTMAMFLGTILAKGTRRPVI